MTALEGSKIVWQEKQQGSAAEHTQNELGPAGVACCHKVFDS